MSDTHPNLERRLGELQTSVDGLVSWRELVVDPTLKEHGKKIDGIEDIRMQITGVIRFVKILASGVGLIAVVCEILRALHHL